MNIQKYPALFIEDASQRIKNKIGIDKLIKKEENCTGTDSRMRAFLRNRICFPLILKSIFSFVNFLASVGETTIEFKNRPTKSD